MSSLAEQLEDIVEYMSDSLSSVNKVRTGYTPVGTIIAVMGNSAPAHYLACNGQVVNIATYPELANYFEEQFGSKNKFGGDGTTTFGIPDLRGEFLRGTGTNGHTNQGNGANVGEHQDATAFPRIEGNINNHFIEIMTNTGLQTSDIKNPDKLYKAAIELEKEYLKICSLLPEVEKIYIISDEQKGHIEDLRVAMSNMGSSKRTLDNYIHSGTKQPYSILRKKLDELQTDYDTANKDVNDFKAYVDSLRNSCEEAFNLIFVYYYRLKQAEAVLREIDIKPIEEQYSEDFNNCYDLLNRIDGCLKVQPIDVLTVNENVEQLKNIANRLFDDIDNKQREQQLAESAIVYVNRDRKHQNDVHSQLTHLEETFYTGEFVKVYHDANAIYRRMHAEENASER